MRNRIIILFFFIISLSFYFQSLAQFTPEELTERAKWEKFLQEAKIISSSKDFSESEAVTEPWTLVLEKDGVTRRALWKNPEGRLKGFLDSWKCEIAAYRLDKLLGLNMISPTVETQSISHSNVRDGSQADVAMGATPPIGSNSRMATSCWPSTPRA